MAIYILRQAASDGARLLAEALNGRKVFKNGRNFFSGRRANPRPITIRRGDAVVCWGTPSDVPAGAKVLNNAPVRSKFEEAEILRRAGIATVEVSRTRPQARPVAAPVDPLQGIFEKAKASIDEFIDTRPTRTRPYIDGVNGVVRDLNDLIVALGRPAPVAPPAPPQGEWLGRSNTHVGGNDLLRPVANPDFFSKKEDIVQEFRIHCFKGKSIRAGKKGFREGFTERTAHPWVRSYDGGWRIIYDGFQSRRAQRELAAAAVAALGLDFGAVDIGQKRDGSLIVLEVNRAPGLEGGTVDSYARAIEGWFNE